MKVRPSLPTLTRSSFAYTQSSVYKIDEAKRLKHYSVYNIYEANARPFAYTPSIYNIDEAKTLKHVAQYIIYTKLRPPRPTLTRTSFTHSRSLYNIHEAKTLKHCAVYNIYESKIPSTANALMHLLDLP